MEVKYNFNEENSLDMKSNYFSELHMDEKDDLGIKY